MIGLAAGAALFGALVFAGSRSGTEPSPPESATQALIEPSGDPKLVDPARIAAEASSVLEPQDGLTYGLDNTLDGDRQTAWNSNSTELIGQTLTYRFAEPVELTALRFVNGYAKSDDIYTSNHRLKMLQVTTDQTTRSLTLLDTDDAQEISFDFGLTSKVVLEVIDIFEGDGFDNPEISSDLALSEIAFLAVQPG